MATNTNTSKEDAMLSTDIYEISDFIDDIRKNNITDISDTASIVGMFGYMNEIFSQTLQNTLIVVSETSNETIPTRAKFSKNVIAHALNYGITKIMSQSLMLFMLLEKTFSLSSLFESGNNIVFSLGLQTLNPNSRNLFFIRSSLSACSFVNQGEARYTFNSLTVFIILPHQ